MILNRCLIDQAPKVSIQAVNLKVVGPQVTHFLKEASPKVATLKPLMVFSDHT
jgi:hypothetical protein